MSEVGWCDQCGEPYRDSWSDPGICAACVLDNFKQEVREEIIEPWALPLLRWLNRKLEGQP